MPLSCQNQPHQDLKCQKTSPVTSMTRPSAGCGPCCGPTCWRADGFPPPVRPPSRWQLCFHVFFAFGLFLFGGRWNGDLRLRSASERGRHPNPTPAPFRAVEVPRLPRGQTKPERCLCRMFSQMVDHFASRRRRIRVERQPNSNRSLGAAALSAASNGFPNASFFQPFAWQKEKPAKIVKSFRPVDAFPQRGRSASPFGGDFLHRSGLFPGVFYVLSRKVLFGFQDWHKRFPLEYSASF